MDNMQDMWPAFGGMYNSIWSENKINPILSLFCVAEKPGGNLGNNIF
jgi:hypothetical protein